MTDPLLLIVEDDADLRSLLKRALTEEGFDVRAVADGASALADSGPTPDALVIDIGLPDADGRDVCQALRARGVSAPVLFLTARDALSDRLSGFSAGGDDYLTKPFHLAELVVRLRSLVKRSGVISIDCDFLQPAPDNRSLSRLNLIYRIDIARSHQVGVLSGDVEVLRSKVHRC